MELAQRSRQWRDKARVLAEVFGGRAARWDRTEQYPHENVRDLAQAGFMAMTIAAGHGGPGAALAEVVAVIEEIAKGCGISGRIVVDGNLGALSIIMSAGPDWMKRRVESLVLAGDKPVIAISAADRGLPGPALENGGRADRAGRIPPAHRPRGDPDRPGHRPA